MDLLARPKKLRLLPAKLIGLPRDEALEVCMVVYKMDLEAARRHLKLDPLADLYITNYARGPSNYHVIVRQGPNVPKQMQAEVQLAEIEIRTIDNKGIFDWSDIQEIKNELFSTKHEALELYPANSRLIRDKNVRYIYVLTNQEKAPIGHG